MIVDLPLILAALTLFTGVITLVDGFLLSRRRRRGRAARTKKLPLTIEYARAFFPVLLVMFLLRSFVIQPYRVPTASLEPTVAAGDFILVNQYEYGLHLPVWNTKIMPMYKPKRGQIALFYYPVNARYTFVKRIIGLPGDRISYINKVLYINDKKAELAFVSDGVGHTVEGKPYKVKIYNETLNGVTHQLYLRPEVAAVNFYNLEVPKGHYFMLGDNRDTSNDSRYWGFVSGQDLIGRATLVWMSWDAHAKSVWHKVRWDRIGKSL